MIEQPSSVLFYARDFLSQEFPALAQNLPTYERVYIVTKQIEADNVTQRDPKGHIFDLGAYIRDTTPAMIVRDAQFAHMHTLVARDRYLRRMTPPQIAQVVHGLRRMLDDIAANFSVEFYFDEPVSGFINDAINRWVRAGGGQCCHFQTTWLPGHMFFAADAGQKEPVALNMMEGGEAKIETHIEQRLKNQALPAYLHNYNSPLRTLKETIRFAAMGLNRMWRKSSIFIDSDPWPHFFQARCLWMSLFARYDKMSEFKQLDNPKLVVFPLHYEPEAVIYYFSKFTNQLDLACAIFDRLPPDTYLVLKEHPSQPGATRLPKWRELLANERVKIIKGTDKLADLLAFESAVVSIASTAALEAAMLGRPAYVVGTPHFRHFPGVKAIDDVNTLELKWDQTAVPHSEMAKWYGAYLDANATPLQIMRGRTNIPDPVALLRSLGLDAEQARA